TRVDLRKNRSKPPRAKSWTQGFHQHGYLDEATHGQERVRAKGDLSRRRTILTEDDPAGVLAGQAGVAMPAADLTHCLSGRVLRMQGLHSLVETDDGREFRCSVRRLLKTLVTDSRNIVTAGDHV